MNIRIEKQNPMMQPNYPCAFMPQLAHAYVPYQCMENIYSPMRGLTQGTVFPELDMPYGMNPEYTLDE